MKKVLITSGGTREYIDDVRVLTNISSGKLGSVIADRYLSENKFARHAEPEVNYEVHYVYAKGSMLPMQTKGIWSNRSLKLHEVTDVQSVYDTLKVLVPQMDIVIHCMAVSDFGFKPYSTKLKSNDPQAFIESLKERIYQTPKILSEIPEWNPHCDLVSFKFEVSLEHDELIRIASESGWNNGCELVIANDKAEMIKEGKHIAYAIPIEPFYEIGPVTRIEDKESIAEFIFDYFRK